MKKEQEEERKELKYCNDVLVCGKLFKRYFNVIQFVFNNILRVF